MALGADLQVWAHLPNLAWKRLASDPQPQHQPEGPPLAQPQGLELQATL